jgi:hypothetical protein
MAAKAKSEPHCTEVVCSASVGAKVQVVKFEYNPSFNFFMSRTYSIPSDWTERDVEDFQVSKEIELRGILEPIAQAEVEELERQREEHSGGAAE